MILFVTGIDTGIGKSVATGLLGAWFVRQGLRTITQKLVQTGCDGVSEDILLHRQLMGIGVLPEDEQRLTCPATYPFPASPHLAAQLRGEWIDVARIVDCTRQLSTRYDVVLVEGAGGLLVPLTPDTTILDVVTQQAWPVVLVTAPRLGSINHTLLSLSALCSRGTTLAAVVYNLHYGAAPEIVSDTRGIIRKAIVHMSSDAPILDVPGGVDADHARAWDDEGLRMLLKYATRTNGR